MKDFVTKSGYVIAQNEYIKYLESQLEKEREKLKQKQAIVDLYNLDKNQDERQGND